MTSRLKHKLELEQINLKSAYLNESFVQIGTPLPALAQTKKDQLEYVPEWKQEVRDEQGRRRFHGAFTGGFSAGYYNSVGSKEGWTPSEFKSSRSNRANKTQRAEDFMDEEDLAQMNEDRRLENTETFQDGGFAGMRDPSSSTSGGDSLSGALESMIAPAKSSIGQTLLQKLGWRPGQGIGPRVTLRKLRVQEGKLGKARNGIAVDDDEDEDMGTGNGESSKHTYAPRDSRLLVYAPKEDREGLGYEKGSGMGRLPAKMPVGARRPDEDEEEDPYAVMGESSNSRAFAFDHGDEDEDVVIMGDSSAISRAGSSNVTARKEGDTEHWHDGRPVLPGFSLDPLSVPTDKWFAMPDIPPDWRPRPARVWGTTRKWDQAPGATEPEKEVIRGAPGKPLTFEQRGEALGEEQRVSKAKSVFEYISEKDRERLAALAAAARTNAPPPAPLSMEEPEEPPEAPPRPTEVVIPPLSPRTAGAALRGFIPYGDDLPKQDRYKSYLSSQTLNTIQPEPVLRKGTIDEINKELEGFAASARIFKPMSFAMSNRFTSGSASLASSDLKQAKPGLHLYDAVKAAELSAAPKEPEVQVHKSLTPREQAAKNGMYGPLTRTIKEFYPIKLLCRRFGVLDPHPEGPPTEGGIDMGNVKLDPLETMALPKNDATWQDAFIHQAESDVPAPRTTEESTTENAERVPRNIAEVGMAEDVNQGRDTLTYTKPSIDIFKAIFASDDEDSDDEDDKPPPPAANKANGTTKKWSNADSKPADLATFKPVFAKPSESKTNGTEEPNAEGSVKKDKKRKKAKRSGVLSFDTGEEGEQDAEASERQRSKRRGLENRTIIKEPTAGLGSEDNGHGANGTYGASSVKEEVADEDLWVEKPAINPRMAGRKGAADFM